MKIGSETRTLEILVIKNRNYPRVNHHRCGNPEMFRWKNDLQIVFFPQRTVSSTQGTPTILDIWKWMAKRVNHAPDIGWSSPFVYLAFPYFGVIKNTPTSFIGIIGDAQIIFRQFNKPNIYCG